RDVIALRDDRSHGLTFQISFLKIPHSIKYFVQNRYNSCEKIRKENVSISGYCIFEQKLKK
ncbi:TPA: hypothetical protein ACJHEN_004381, partial [Escherichia coli]